MVFCCVFIVTDVISRYTWVIPLKDKKVTMTVNASQSIVKESNCKPNKICFEKDIEFYNKSM